MKSLLSCGLALLISSALLAAGKDSTTYYNLPDSVKAVAFLAEFKVQTADAKGYFSAGIYTDAVGLYLHQNKGKTGIRFSFPSFNSPVTPGDGVSFNFPSSLQAGETYKLLIATASDSAGNFSIYSGYAWLPNTGKWKLIGTCRLNGRWNTLQQPAFITSRKKRTGNDALVTQAWCQRNTGNWKNLLADEKPVPVINYFGHADSLAQSVADTRQIEDSIAAGMSNLVRSPDGIYYTILKEGTGMPVTLSDTVTVYYKGWLFADGTVFDQTKDKPATFPLKRLIRGWQVGLPLCHTGAKIRLVIPSGLAYSIRTRAAKIPPNSILVFDIEVVDTKRGR